MTSEPRGSSTPVHKRRTLHYEEPNELASQRRVEEVQGAPALTNDDLDRYEGKRDRLVGHIQEKTGEKRKAIRD